MAILSYLTVTAAATPMSPESPGSAPSPEQPKQTKVILPKKKPMKWSTGVAPGDYGGPPTTTKLRKYWGGEEKDPLASDEFMWNKDFVGRFKRLIQDPQPAPLTPPKEEPSGFLSLNRVMSLDSLEVDLSKELSTPVNRNLNQQIEEETDVTKSKRVIWKLAPTRREQEKWDRATKAATGGSDVMFREIRRPREDPEVLAAKSQEQYNKLKTKLQFLTLGIGGVGLVSAYVSYSPEIAASFGAGLLGSLAYIRMLGSSVDSLKTDGSKALIKGAIGQPRLLVPVILVMVYNRWNSILVPEFGSMHLELIPMLVGFFTYKIATFVQAIEDALTVAVKKT
ncbi:protein CONSERVED ONLY IN THE GREEN LINEAGE 160, chloroplastic [Arachis stenosperma]|uniref:protein CONSERVED ONLY IN THE GREEN LINEAGE 160, chloroplastic n=1 Tax=Arachis stenosperma TaxID=217475 RepID=UPI0025ABFE1F|nr:protein CONSERVED ONLY IN THE GREEN LINEAGE 160, chloroplastic [Arachis stenosperma]